MQQRRIFWRPMRNGGLGFVTAGLVSVALGVYAESPLGPVSPIDDVVPHAALDALQLAPRTGAPAQPPLQWKAAQIDRLPTTPSAGRSADRRAPVTTPSAATRANPLDTTRSVLRQSHPAAPVRLATRAPEGLVDGARKATAVPLAGPALAAPNTNAPSVQPSPLDESPQAGAVAKPKSPPLREPVDCTGEAPPVSAFDATSEVPLGSASDDPATESPAPDEDDHDSSYREPPTRAPRTLDADPNAKPIEQAPARVPSAAETPPSTATPRATNPPTPPKRPAAQPAPRTPSPVAKQPRSDDQRPAPLAGNEPPAPLSRSMTYLRSRLRTVLSYYYRKPLNSTEHDAWEVMHGMLAYELYSRILDGGPTGKPITAIGHLCFNRPSARKQLLYLTKDGDLDVRVGVGVQGHSGQFLAMLAQCNVSPDYPIRVEGRELTVQDLIRSEQRTCYAKTELTFKLIGLGHYLDSNATWVNEQGEQWDIPRLVREERVQPIRGAACGGTHRLSGLSLAYRRREARGEPVDGEYLEAARFVSQYQTQCFRQQNDDGSLSTSWFNGPGEEEDIERRLRTTGHQLEWLVYSLPDKQLRSAQTLKTINYLVNLLATNANQEWHVGSLGHAVHALVVYDKRVFQPHDSATAAGAGLAASGAIDPAAGLYRGYNLSRGVMRNSEPQSAGIFGLFGTPRTSGRTSGSRR